LYGQTNLLNVLTDMRIIPFGVTFPDLFNGQTATLHTYES